MGVLSNCSIIFCLCHTKGHTWIEFVRSWVASFQWLYFLVGFRMMIIFYHLSSKMTFTLQCIFQHENSTVPNFPYKEPLIQAVIFAELQGTFSLTSCKRWNLLFSHQCSTSFCSETFFKSTFLFNFEKEDVEGVFECSLIILSIFQHGHHYWLSEYYHKRHIRFALFAKCGNGGN